MSLGTGYRRPTRNQGQDTGNRAPTGYRALRTGKRRPGIMDKRQGNDHGNEGDSRE
jgi:hypothetical protein